MEVTAIGSVENGVYDVQKHDWEEVESKIVLKSAYEGGLKGLEEFSHAEILFFLHKVKYDRESDLLGRARGKLENPLVGVFSRRTNHRPNGIGVTVVKILEVGDDYLIVKGLDAVDGTAILDIKPYTPRIAESAIKIPNWAKRNK